MQHFLSFQPELSGYTTCRYHSIGLYTSLSGKINIFIIDKRIKTMKHSDNESLVPPWFGNNARLMYHLEGAAYHLINVRV